MKNSIKYLLLSAAALAAVSCESWLDVTPPSEIRAEDHYSSAEGFQQTLIGCYLAMGETDLYGENLTWHMVEMLGRQYDARKNTAADDYDLDRYNYKTTKSTEVIEKVWEKSYSVIANVNDALDHIDRRKDELDSVNYRIIKGELLAVRAYIHFDLMRLFGSGRIASMMDRMGLKEGEVIQAGMMTRAIERAQKKVEENNFGIRKRLLEYDDVMNSQREVIYTRRRHALYGERIEIDLNNIMYDYADNFVETNRGIEFEDFRFELIREVAVEPSFGEETYGSAKPAELVELIVKDLKETYARRAKAVADTVRPVMERIYEDKKDQLDSNIYFPITDGHLGYNVPVNLLKCKNTDGAEIYKIFSKVVMFTTIDDAWREHLREMDDLRQSVQNATYEQKDPLLIYKFESFGLFSKMIVKVNRDVLAILNKAYIPVRDQNAEAVQRERQERAKVDVNKLQASRMQAAAQAGQQDKQKPMPVHVEKKVGRNDPCPCGSGKKYKQCHGKGI